MDLQTTRRACSLWGSPWGPLLCLYRASDASSRWLKFDDDRVTPVTDREVLEENFGGEVLNGVPPTLQRNQVRSMKRFSNAYMLVYIREAATEDVLPPFKEEDTPAHLSK